MEQENLVATHVQLEKIFVSPTWRDLTLYAHSKTQEPHVREREGDKAKAKGRNEGEGASLYIGERGEVGPPPHPPSHRLP
jgi:hypothetical protein